MLLPLFAMLLQAPAPTAPPAGDPPARVARISYLDGTVSFQPGGDTSWSDATLNYTTTTGDRLYTDQDSRAELEVGPFTVRLSETSDLTLTNLTDQFMQLGLARGSMILRVYQLQAGDSVEVDTPNGALTIVDSGEYRFTVYAADSTTIVAVGRGSLVVGGGSPAQIARSGEAIQLSGTDPIQLTNVTPPDPDDFDRWSADRDRTLDASPSAQYVGRDVPGYSELDDAGNWDQDAQYGPVWYPSGMPVGWVPYRNGHWAWIEPWGWTWISEERWGYAPFHYGRWVNGRRGWGWVPGRRVERPCYAPALVAFVSVGTVGVQAWFPLGPNEPYIPAYHNDLAYRRRVNAPNFRSDADVDVRVRDVNKVRYVNRGVALTAVSATTFRGGEPIERRIVPVRPEQVSQTRISPHPTMLPTTADAAGGRRAPNPPIGARPLVTPFRPQQPMVIKRTPAPTPIVRSPSPAILPTRPDQPSQPMQPSRPARMAPPPPLIARTPPPPANVPFVTRQKAMQPDPGRPLEPQQIQNLRTGKPAGPHRDPEIPAHPALRPAPKPAPPQKPAPAVKPPPKPDRRP